MYVCVRMHCLIDLLSVSRATRSGSCVEDSSKKSTAQWRDAALKHCVTGSLLECPPTEGLKLFTAVDKVVCKCRYDLICADLFADLFEDRSRSTSAEVCKEELSAAFKAEVIRVVAALCKAIIGKRTSLMCGYICRRVREVRKYPQEG